MNDIKGVIRTNKLMHISVSGFTSIVNHIINMAKFYVDIYGNYDILVDHQEFNEIFDTKINHNMVEYTFDFEQEFINANFPTLNESNAHMVYNDKVNLKSKIFHHFFRLKDEDYYNKFKKEFINDKTLAIHLRGTDKHNEIIPPKTEDILFYIDDMLNNNDIDNIFLATDDILYRNMLIERYGNMINYIKSNRISFDSNPLHFIDNRLSLNKEVMLDTYLLSQSKYFLYCFSNVSYLALVMGIDNFKKINCLNINI